MKAFAEEEKIETEMMVITSEHFVVISIFSFANKIFYLFPDKF